MIEQKEQNNQLPNKLKSVFNELEILKHLRKANHPKKSLIHLFLFVSTGVLPHFPTEELVPAFGL